MEQRESKSRMSRNRLSIRLISSLDELTSLNASTIAFYGGSFNPVHSGHCAVAESALKEFVEAVVFCPHSHNRNKPGLGKTISFRIELLSATVENFTDPEKVVIAKPNFLNGIQNAEFVKLTHELSARDVTSFVLIGADALSVQYPTLLRRLPHLVAPRSGYGVDTSMLCGVHHTLRGVQYHLSRMIRKNTVDRLKAGYTTPRSVRQQNMADINKFMNDCEACCMYHFSNTPLLTLDNTRTRTRLNDRKLTSIANKCNQLDNDEEMEECYKNLLKNWRGINSIYEIGHYYKKAEQSGVPFEVPIEVRYALANLCILTCRRGGGGFIELAEECILNASYKSTDAAVSFIAGLFYLWTHEPDPDTATAYFKIACESDSSFLPMCDSHFAEYLEERSWEIMNFYRKYLDLIVLDWKNFKSELSTKPELRFDHDS